jgi:hypothetical protein
MVNYGWGDNALGPPFVEKPAAEPLVRVSDVGKGVGNVIQNVG